MIGTAMCLAMAIYYETRSEPNPDAGLAVAEFSFYCDGKPERPKHKEAWLKAQEQAREALNGNLLGHGALYYHANYTSPIWRHNLELIGKIGKHIFYTDMEVNV